MNKILLSKMHRLANGRLVVPFSCPEASGYHLQEPAYNRTLAEQELAESLARRMRLVLAPLGYHLEGVNWSSMRLTLTEKT
jgi:hypothetical protein